MGWTGTFLYWNRHDTNKDLFLRAYPSYRKLLEENKIQLSQKGSNVYMLYQCDITTSENFGKRFVCCFLCQRDSKRSEFLTKDIDAISNSCFDFPKSWLDFLDKSDSDIQKYIQEREEWENKQKSKGKFEIGDYAKCIASYEISWSNGRVIKKDEEFYIQIGCLNPYASKKTKSYVVVVPRSDWKGEWSMQSSGCRIKGNTFKHCKSVVKLSEDDVKQIVEAEHQKVIKQAKKDFGVA